jgi:hypothetical protein
MTGNMMLATQQLGRADCPPSQKRGGWGLYSMQKGRSRMELGQLPRAAMFLAAVGSVGQQLRRWNMAMSKVDDDGFGCGQLGGA